MLLYLKVSEWLADLEEADHSVYRACFCVFCVYASFAFDLREECVT